MDEKYIRSMAKDICLVRENCNDVCNPTKDCKAMKYAKRAYEKGYRYQGDLNNDETRKKDE